VFLAMKGQKENNLCNPILALPVSNRDKMLMDLGVKDTKERIARGEIGARSGILFFDWRRAGGERPEEVPDPGCQQG